MEVYKNGGTPSYHPFIDRIFHYKPSSHGGTPISGNPQIVNHGKKSTSVEIRPDFAEKLPWISPQDETPSEPSKKARSEYLVKTGCTSTSYAGLIPY